MTIYKALQKIDTLTPGELSHFVQLCEDEIRRYKICIENYPLKRMKRAGIPFLKSLEERKRKFVEALANRPI